MKLPASLQALFDQLLEFWPEGIVAGGAVRDGLLGYPINDIDLWVQSRLPGPWEDLDFSEQDQASEYELQTEEVQVTGVGQWAVPDCPYPVQVMPIRISYADPRTVSPRLLVRRFDYGICMVAYTRREGLIVTPEFKADAAAKKFTQLDGSFTNAARRTRLMAKFAGWSFP